MSNQVLNYNDKFRYNVASQAISRLACASALYPQHTKKDAQIAVLLRLLNELVGKEDEHNFLLARMLDDKTNDITGFCINRNLSDDVKKEIANAQNLGLFPDNKSLSKDYIDSLKRLNPQMVQRMIYGKWPMPDPHALCPHCQTTNAHPDHARICKKAYIYTKQELDDYYAQKGR